MLTLSIIAVLALLVMVALGAVAALHRRNVFIWLPAYLRRPSAPHVDGPVDILLCIADHYEPGWNQADFALQSQRVKLWTDRYPGLAERFRDAHGRPLQYSFFFPEEEYHPAHLDALASLCRRGFGDVEVHLHHHNDTEAGLREKLIRFKTTLHQQHGLLRRDPVSGDIVYAFIHGNWTLDNSAPDGSNCGVNNELIVLRETGCYADFTLPSAPEPMQTSKINSIYYATDDPQRPKSHDSGVDVRVGGSPSGDLLMVQGPLAFNWRSRRLGLMPRIENGELSADNPPTRDRVDLWIRQHIHVVGRPEWVFVKLHAHGANERHSPILLGQPMEQMLEYLQQKYNDGRRYRLHYVTAREMVNVIKAAEAGKRGDAGEYRDFRPAPAAVPVTHP